MDVALTEHVIKRWSDRVKPGMGFEEAKAELTALVELSDGEPVKEVPWHQPDPDETFDRYLVISDGIALGCQIVNDVLVAVSVFVPGNLDLRRRRKHRRRRRRRDQAKKRHENMLRRAGISRKPTDGLDWPE